MLKKEKVVYKCHCCLNERNREVIISWGGMEMCRDCPAFTSLDRNSLENLCRKDNELTVENNEQNE